MRLPAEDTTHDADITDAIDAATEQFEQDVDRAVITQTFVYQANAFPAGAIDVPKAPIQSVVDIKYLDADGNEQTVPSEDYKVDQGRRMVYLVSGATWPATIVQQNAVTLTFIAGYGDGPSNVPRLIQRAISLQVGRWFFDPAMENADQYTNDAAYQKIVLKLVPTDHQAA